MNSTKYYLFIASGLLTLILSFFVKVITPVGVFNEFYLISKIKWNNIIPKDWYVYTYFYTYYLVRIGIIIALLTSPRRETIAVIFLLFLISIISDYFIFSNDSKLVTTTFLPYLLSVAVWLYLGLMMPKGKN